MAQQMKALISKHDDPSSIPRIHKLERDNEVFHRECTLSYINKSKYMRNIVRRKYCILKSKQK